MIGALKNFFGRLRSALLWVRACRLCSDGRHLEALRLLRSADDKTRTLPRWRLKEIHELGLLDYHVGALEAAKPLIDEFLAKPHLTSNEKYFLAFAQWYGRLAFGALYSSAPAPATLERDLSSFSLADVAPRWKRTFPMPIHPEWDDLKPASEQGIARKDEVATSGAHKLLLGRWD